MPFLPPNQQRQSTEGTKGSILEQVEDKKQDGWLTRFAI